MCYLLALGEMNGPALSLSMPICLPTPIVCLVNLCQSFMPSYPYLVCVVAGEKQKGVHVVRAPVFFLLWLVIVS